MARVASILTPGNTNVSKLVVLPNRPGTHTGSPDTQDATWATLTAGGGVAFGNNSVPPPAGTIGVPALHMIASYTPLTNSGGAITTGAFGIVTFDSASTGFPFRPGDVILGGKMANFAPKSTESFAADPLDDLGGAPGVFVVGWSLSGHNGSDKPLLNALVYNSTGGTLTVPATWLPPIYILRLAS